MYFPSLQKPPLHLHPWFLIVLACYAVMELSFNHRLLELAGSLELTTTAEQLLDIEIWGRVVSGLGLALLLVRWLDRFIKSKILLLALCFSLGLFSMWHVQKALVDTIVARADSQDLWMSLRS